MDPNLASDAEITELVAALSSGDGEDLVHIDRLLARYPDDPRLHFMRGSVLAGLGRAIEAHEAMARAIDIAPGYALARYQLGFFELTSGKRSGRYQPGGRCSCLRKTTICACLPRG